MTSSEVASRLVIYGRANCPQCHATVRKAKALGLPYRYVDLAEDRDAECRLQLEGHRTLPVVEAGDAVWNGFRPDRLEAMVMP